MTDAGKLFLLDGMALAYRAHFAMIRNPRVTSAGMNTSAIFGFLNTVQDIIKNREPTHLAVAFDTPEPTFRHKEYPEYKATRGCDAGGSEYGIARDLQYGRGNEHPHSSLPGF